LEEGISTYDKVLESDFERIAALWPKVSEQVPGSLWLQGQMERQAAGAMPEENGQLIRCNEMPDSKKPLGPKQLRSRAGPA